MQSTSMTEGRAQRRGRATVGRIVATALATAGLFLGMAIPAAAQSDPPTPRLYVLDCGTLEGRNLSTYGLPEEQRDLSVTCFLVVHGRGTLLWEAGLGDRFADGQATPSDPRWQVGRTLRSQLAEIGFAPGDITYLAISHMHADHTGNAADYTGSTWLVQESELDWAFDEARDTSTYGALAGSSKTVLRGDHNVFGDGTVVITSTPGHTPGHQSLLVWLPETGPILLSGDLYHYPEERTFGKIPSFDVDREQTATSRARIEELLRATGAQLWIEHDILAYAGLKKAPAYYR